MTATPGPEEAFDRRSSSPGSSSAVGQQGAEALEKEARLPLTGWQQEVEQGLRYGLEAAESIVDRRI